MYWCFCKTARLRLRWSILFATMVVVASAILNCLYYWEVRESPYASYVQKVYKDRIITLPFVALWSSFSLIAIDIAAAVFIFIGCILMYVRTRYVTRELNAVDIYTQMDGRQAYRGPRPGGNNNFVVAGHEIPAAPIDTLSEHEITGLDDPSLRSAIAARLLTFFGLAFALAVFLIRATIWFQCLHQSSKFFDNNIKAEDGIIVVAGIVFCLLALIVLVQTDPAKALRPNYIEHPAVQGGPATLAGRGVQSFAHASYYAPSRVYEPPIVDPYTEPLARGALPLSDHYAAPVRATGPPNNYRYI